MRIKLVIFVLLLSSTVLAQQASRDWTQWRGPSRDGSAPSFTPPKAWPQMLTERWKVEVGLGYATPLVVGDRVFTFTRQGEEEVLTALDAASGKQIWATRYPAPYTVVKAAMGHGPGPKGTPVFADGRIFTFGISGILSAFDAATGKQLWQKPAPEVGPMFTTSQSPLVEGGLVIAHVGGNNKGALTAFDPATGAERWKWEGDGPGYGSPVVAEFGGVRQVVTMTYQNLVGVNARTGALLWQRPFRSRSDVNAITPIIHRDTAIVSGGDAGVVAVRVTRQGEGFTASEAWRLDETYLRFSNLVLVNDMLFGLAATGSGTYIIIDANSGKLVWEGEPRAAENASFVKAGTTLLILEADGDLLVADGSNTSAITPLQRYKVADQATWGAPAVSGNRILVKDISSVRLMEVG